jgi:hypothetical protein
MLSPLLYNVCARYNLLSDLLFNAFGKIKRGKEEIKTLSEEFRDSSARRP